MLLSREIFPFLDLPLELRFEVYRYLLVATKIIIVDELVGSPGCRKTPRRSMWEAEEAGDSEDDDTEQTYLATYASWEMVNSSRQYRGPIRSIDLNIMSASRKIYRETCQIFYKENVFAFTWNPRLQPTPVTTTAAKFLSDCSAKARASIQSIELTTRVCDLDLVTHVLYDEATIGKSGMSMQPEFNLTNSTEILWSVFCSLPSLRSLRLRLEDEYEDAVESTCTDVFALDRPGLSSYPLFPILKASSSITNMKVEHIPNRGTLLCTSIPTTSSMAESLLWPND